MIRLRNRHDPPSPERARSGPVIYALELRARVHCCFYLRRQGGGLPLVFGLLIASGLFGLIVRVMRHLRALFPPEVTGLWSRWWEIELNCLAAPRFLASPAQAPVDKLTSYRSRPPTLA